MTFDAPLTPMQQRVWFVEASSPGRPDFNICTAHRLQGRIDAMALQRAFQSVVSEHGALRLRFHTNEAGEVRQALDGDVPQLALESAQGLDESQLLERLTAIRQEPFDLVRGPLCRASLLRLREDEAVFIFVGHHLICDGWSMMVLGEAMARRCAAATDAQHGDDAGQAGLRVDAYLAFARDQQDWLVSEEAKSVTDHWVARLTPMPEPLALTTMHAVAQQADAQPDAQRVQVPVSADALAAFRQLARTLDVSMFTVLLAVYGLVLGRTAGQRDLAVGIPVKGRHASELDAVIGFFANTLPVRLTWQADTTFAGLLAHVSGRLKNAMSHAELPFERLIQRLPIRRDSGRHPVYQAQFSYLDLRRRTDRWGELARSSINVPTFGGGEDLSLLLIERQDGSVLEWCHRADVLPEVVVQRLIRRFLRVLAVVTQPGAPHTLVDALDWMDEGEHRDVVGWSRGPARIWPDACAWDLLRRASVDRQAPALFAGAWLDHEALFQRATRMASALKARGVAPGARVGLYLEQGPWVTQAILAVWACGAAYVPLDPSHPPERIQMILDEAACDIILVDAADQGRAPCSWSSEVVESVDVAALLLDEPGLHPAASPRMEEPFAGRADDVAYIMFTSGSTGRPKGVVVTQGAVVNLLCALRETLQVTPSDRWLAVTTPGFDISVLESFLPLAAGASLAWASSTDAQDGEALAALMREHEVTCLQGTPATWALLCAAIELRHDRPWAWQGRFLALVGGEALPHALASQMLGCGFDVWNMYGPTETTVWSTCMRVTPASRDAGIAIGRPIANTLIWVRDDAGVPCPCGVRGQIHIGGDCLAQGYWRRDDLSAAHFVTVQGPDGKRVRAFASGDVGLWDEQGRLRCLGRVDRQIKWRGFRIEPGEIELAVTRVTACRAVVAKLVDTSAGPTLAAFIEGGAEMSLQTLRERLLASLPSYMVPAHFAMLNAGLPRLPNGKVDFRALDAGLLIDSKPSRMPAAPGGVRSALAQVLWDVWREVLQTQDIQAEDNFFDLGGHSLLALKATNLMAQRTGVQLGPQRYVFENFQQLTCSYERAQHEVAHPKSPLVTSEPLDGGALERIRRGLFDRLPWSKSGI